MVRAKLQYYYTFKIAGENPLIVEAHKWEEETGDHSGTTYKINPNNDWQGCDCPAWRKCKHQRCVQEAIESGKIASLWKWRWDEKKGWTELKDIVPMEDL